MYTYKTGNPLAYEDCNGVADPEENCPNTGNPLAYEDCNLSAVRPVCTVSAGNPLAYEDCNCKIFVICECYSTKDLLSYGGKCKKYLHGAKALNLIPITFYYRTNSP